MENYWDIQGVPRRYFFELLSHLTTSDLEEEKLQEFTSTEGQVMRHTSLQTSRWTELIISCMCYLVGRIIFLLLPSAKNNVRGKEIQR